MKAVNPKIILYLGVLGTAFSALLVRLSDAPSLTTATLRLMWTILLLAPVTLKAHWAEVKTATKADILACGLSGVFLALHFATWFESLKWTTVASSSVLGCTEVIFVALGFAIFLKGKIPKLGVLAIALSFGGSVILALHDGGAGAVGANPLYGDLLAIACAVCVAINTLIGRVKRGNMSTTVYTFFTYLACLITLLILDGFTGTPLTGWPLKEHLIGLGLAVFCTLLGHSLFSWSLKYIAPSYVSAAKLCEPIFSSAIAIPLFHEVPGPIQLLGAAIILAGVLLYTVADNRQAEEEAAAAPQSSGKT